jgi:acyl-CoA synthetase (AMP-forming)/AMP-acid ligase II
MLLHDYFEYWARFSPHREFGVDRSRRLSYGEAAQEAARLAAGLRAAGVGPGDRVAILAGNRLEYPLVTFAVLRLGAVVVPVNVRLAPAELGLVLNDAEPQHIFVDTDSFESLQAIPGGLPDGTTLTEIGPAATETGFASYEDLLAAASDAPSANRAPPTADAVQFYTSGTTGQAKGVVHSHRSLGLATSYWRTAYPLSPDERQLVVLPTFHTGGFLAFLHTSICGASARMLNRFDPEEVLGLVADERIVRVGLVPSMLDSCLDTAESTDPARFSSLRYLSYGGSPITVETMRRALEVFPCGIHQAFGQTESPLLTHLTDDDHLRGLDDPSLLASTGRAVVGVELRIEGADGELLDFGAVGEICARTEHTMTRYWRRPETTDEVLRDGWIHTGDAGYLDERGYLTVVDRFDDMIVSGGENVYPGEVEAALIAHPGVREVAVTGVPSSRWGEEVKAVVVAEPGVDVSASDLIAFCGERIAGYKRPRSVDFVVELPRNASGKVLKRAIREQYAE